MMNAGQGNNDNESMGVHRSRTDNVKMFGEEMDPSEKLNTEIFPSELTIKQRPQWKVKIEKLLENYYWVGMMSFVTFYALFADDLRILLASKSADSYFDVITMIAMSLYLVELVLGVLGVEKYFFSFYFWVDFLSLISMIPDVSFLMEEIEGGLGGAGDGADIAKTGRASKVIKIVRIIRLIRLLRIVKIYK